jgi:hypothetical protein
MISYLELVVLWMKIVAISEIEFHPKRYMLVSKYLYFLDCRFNTCERLSNGVPIQQCWIGTRPGNLLPKRLATGDHAPSALMS